MTHKNRIKLNQNDLKYMLNHFELPREIKIRLEQGTEGLKLLSADDFDLLHDLCNDRLAVHGFDQNYNLTKEGEFLETLLDKLYEC